MKQRTADTIDQSKAEARRLIAAGQKTDSLWMLEMIDEVYQDEREFSEFRGCCSDGCKPENIVSSDVGPICRWTRKPCEGTRLGSLIELYGSINRGPQALMLTDSVLQLSDS